MSFQYTYDASGKPIGVFVPINEWEKLTSELKKRQHHPFKRKNSFFHREGNETSKAN